MKTIDIKFRNVKYFNELRKLYPLISDLDFVPHISFKNGYITMQHVGNTLNQLKLSSFEKGSLKLQIIDIVQSLYDRGVAHRDVHTKNVCWSNGKAYLIDWEYICLHKVDDIKNHYDLCGRGLHSPEHSNNMNIFSKSRYSIKNYLNPIKLNINEFVKS